MIYPAQTCEPSISLPYIEYLGNTAVSTADLAKHVDLSIRQTRELLSDLERRGLVRRVSERGGWLPLEQPAAGSVL